tara:strand:+ start:16610 stop:17848 length:1239 start_codon:yes stop_codon:yes gene_type:complete
MKNIKVREFPGGTIYYLTTNRPDIIIMRGSYLGGDLRAPDEAHADLMVSMLDQGTSDYTRDELNEELELLGVTIDFDYDTQRTRFSASMLKDVWRKGLGLLKSQLTDSAFDSNCFKIMKERIMGEQNERLSNAREIASIAMLDEIYPDGHPNRVPTVQAMIDQLKAATLESVKSYYLDQRMKGELKIVLVGDIDESMIDDIVSEFSGWDKGSYSVQKPKKPAHKAVKKSKEITIPGKVSADVLLGQSLQIDRHHKDFLPLMLGVDALGGNFSARLIRTIRDEMGLTYGIYSHISGVSDLSDGYLSVWANYPPDKISTGIEQTLVLCREWINGLGAQELLERQQGICGRFVLNQSSCSGIAGLILHFTEQGFGPDYIEQYPKDVMTVTLGEVNQAIKQYIDLDNFIDVKAGSI